MNTGIDREATTKEKLFLITFTQTRKGIVTVPAYNAQDALKNVEEIIGEMSDQDYQELAGDGVFEFAVLTELREYVDPNQLVMFEREYAD